MIIHIFPIGEESQAYFIESELQKSLAESTMLRIFEVHSHQYLI